MINIQHVQLDELPRTQISAAASGWAGWALAHPDFGGSVNPITTRGEDYALHITASPPGFENPAATLPCVCNSIFHWKNHKNTWPASDISKVELKIPKRHFKMNWPSTLKRSVRINVHQSLSWGYLRYLGLQDSPILPGILTFCRLCYTVLHCATLWSTSVVTLITIQLCFNNSRQTEFWHFFAQLLN